MDKAQKSKIQSQIRKTNVLESFKDIGSGVSRDLPDQILARPRLVTKASGEIRPGESLELNDLLSGQYQENLRLKKQITLERRLLQEEKTISAQKSNELKVRLQALMQEVLALAKSTQNLGERVEVATMQAPAQPGIYHLVFFEKLLEFIRNFRKNIEDASVWLHTFNKRAEKKNFWAIYKKHGSSFLLSGEHYLTRSAG